MDPVAIEFPAMTNPYDLRIGMVFESDATARAFVNAHAINNNFAVKIGVVKNKDETLLIVCKCNRNYSQQFSIASKLFAKTLRIFAIFAI
ncbi:hypothetical protein V1508DRAFT_443075, partial [Lipomyces doorenjongii]|uniref:uncharacterized protein n=1 Tax=Lipomyces doorenjongii TaxID=383834 RepID=UPI0034CD4672